MTWEEAKKNSDKLTDLIEKLLDKQQPKDISDVINAVKSIDVKTSALPNPNHEGKYCQLILYPSSKWKTWRSTSMSISKYNIYE